MDRFEKRSLTIALALLFLFFGLLVYAVRGLQIEVPTCLTDVPPPQKGELIELGPGRYQLNMVARMWVFEPFEVRVPAGSTVDIYLTSNDVVHGMHIDKTLANIMAIPGTVNYTRVKFDKPGTYQIICHEYCGAAHHNMAGKVIVE